MVPKMVCSVQRWMAEKNRKKGGVLKGRVTERSGKRVEHPAGMPHSRAVHTNEGAPTWVWSTQAERPLSSGIALVFCVRCVESDRATARPKSARKPVDRGQPELVMEWTCNME